MPQKQESHLPLRLHGDVETEILHSPSHLTSTVKPLSKLQNAVGTIFTKRFHRCRFHKFLDLPAEIRLQIWKEALPGPRVHELHPDYKMRRFKTKLLSNCRKTPAILHTCRESRLVALKHLQMMRQFHPPDSETRGFTAEIGAFYFNPAVDTLFLNCVASLLLVVRSFLLEDDNTLNIQLMKGWQSVALDSEMARIIAWLAKHYPEHDSNPRFQQLFPSLEHLLIACDLTNKGRRRLRTSIWPGNDTSLVEPTVEDLKITNENWQNMSCMETMQTYLEEGCGQWTQTPTLEMAKVKRKRFISHEFRYAYRKTCLCLGIRPEFV